jgi:hypothetical protein
VACTPHFKWAAWLYVLLALLLLGALYYVTCRRIKHVDYDKADFADEELPLVMEDPAERTMWILFLLAPDGQKHAVEVMQSEWSIDTVHEKVRLAMGIPIADQVLSFGGRTLRLGKKLTSYGVQNGGEIRVSVRDGAAGVTRQEQKMARRKRRPVTAEAGRQAISPE